MWTETLKYFITLFSIAVKILWYVHILSVFLNTILVLEVS